MGEMISYAGNGVGSEGYLAVPPGASAPAVVVIQARWGLVAHIKEVAERFAGAGFVALAPDLYHGVQAGDAAEVDKLVEELPIDRVAVDLEAAAAYLAGRPGASGKVAAVGFGTGGALAVWSATLTDRIVAAAGFYPALPWERMSPKWSEYAGKSALIHCSEEDGASAAPRIQQARAAIEGAGGSLTLYDYPGTHEAFFNDDRPEVYDDMATTSAWARTLEFLRSNLG
jgi:carboxymethylenebutenolidase